MTEGTFADLFKDAEVISTYTDETAVEDGELVAVTKRDRVTRACWAWLAASLPPDGPPSCWPVDLMSWIGAKTGGDDRALAATRGLLAMNGKLALKAYDAGDIFKVRVAVAAVADVSIIGGIDEGGTLPDHLVRVLWLLPNELGGVTLMLPEDY